MPQPELSLIVPAKDNAPYLGTMFRSLLMQGPVLDRTEILFVNDGSRDETPALLEEFGPQFPHFSVLTNDTPVGLASGRNMGLRAARGEYLAFLDGDDWLPAGQLATTLAAIRSLDVDFVRTDHVRVEGTARSIRRAPMALRHRALPPRVGVLPAHDSTMVDYPFAWAGMFHRRLLDSGLLPFPEGFMTAEDRAWIWNLHLHAQSFAVIDTPGVRYRRGVSGSLTQILDVRQLDFIRAFEGIFELVAEDPDAAAFWPKAARNWLAILEHQAIRFSSSGPEIKKQFAAGARRASSAIPFDVLRSEIARSPRDRQATVIRFMPRRDLLVKDVIK